MPHILSCSEVLALVANAPHLPDDPARLKQALAAMTAAHLDMHTVLFAIAFRESSFDAAVVNPRPGATATGLFQLTETTANDIQDRVVRNFMHGAAIPNLAAGQRLVDHRTDATASAFAAYVYLLDRVAAAGNAVDEGIRRFGNGTPAYVTWVHGAVRAVRQTCGLSLDQPTELLAFNRVARDRCPDLKNTLGHV
jgi:SLT domain-containing protein